MLNNKSRSSFRSCLAFLCVVVLSMNSTNGFATNPVENLEKKTSGLESSLNTLRDELLTLTKDVEDLSAKAAETAEAAEATELNLAAAKLSQESQYEKMKKRIKYMYENGSLSSLELICSAKSMSEFVNNTSFVVSIAEYDREQLEELKALHDKIVLEQQELINQQAELAQTQQDLEDKRTTLSTKISSTESQLALTEAQLAGARAAATTPSSSSTTATSGGNSNQTNNGGVTHVPPVPSTASDIALLAAILECEAGSTNYNALLAVGTVIMNRVATPGYGNTVRDVIYQRGQFSPVASGKLDRVLANGPKPLCLTVARDTLNGARYGPVSHCLSFRAAASSNRTGVIVGGNVFF